MIKFPSISDKKIKLTLHAIAWIFVILIPLYLNSAFGGNEHRLNQFYAHTFSAFVVFYVGYLWLVPKFFLKERYWVYFIILVVVINASYFMTSLSMIMSSMMLRRMLNFRSLSKNGSKRCRFQASDESFWIL